MFQRTKAQVFCHGAVVGTYSCIKGLHSMIGYEIQVPEKFADKMGIGDIVCIEMEEKGKEVPYSIRGRDIVYEIVPNVYKVAEGRGTDGERIFREVKKEDDLYLPISKFAEASLNFYLQEQASKAVQEEKEEKDDPLVIDIDI